MANLPKYLEKIQVEYVKTTNGINEKGSCNLSELLSDQMNGVRQDITSLALLPLYNKDNTLFEAANNPSKYIKDFPMLQTLSYPNQWGEISPKSMQNANCPNLRTILRTVPEGYSGEVSEISIKGTPNIVLKEDGSEEIQTYGEVIGAGTELYSIIHVNPKTPVKSKSSKSKGQQYVTYDILIQKIEEINNHLVAMERKINQGNAAQITKTKITNILNNFVGRITEEQLDAIMAEIRKGIDVNIPVDTIIENIENLESLVSNGFANISKQENNHYHKLLAEIQAIAESDRGRDEQLIAIKELILSKSAEYFRTNNSLLQQILIKQGLIEAEITKDGGINDKLDLLGIGMEDLVNLIINEFKDMHDSVSHLATSDEVKEIMMTALGQFASEIKKDILEGNRDYLEAIGKTLSTIPTIDSIRQIVEEGFKKSSLANAQLLRYATDEIVDRIINSFGDIAHLDETDLEKISGVFLNIIEGDHFKSVMSNIINDEHLAKIDNIEELRIALEGKLDSVFDSFSKKLDGLATREDITKLISLDQDGEFLGLIPNFIRKHLSSMGIVTKEDLKNLQVSSPEIFVMLKEINERMTRIEQNQNNQQSNLTVNIDLQNQIAQSIQAAFTSAMNMYAATSAYSSMLMQGGMVVGGLGQYNPNIAQLINVIGSLNSGNILNVINQQGSNAYVSNLLQLLISQYGLIPQQQKDPEVDKLKEELDKLKQKQQQDHDELKKLIEELTEEVKKLHKTPEEEEKKKEDPVEPIELPKPTGKTKIVKGTIKHLTKLKQPKLPLRKRIGKFIVRHPLASAVIGLGIGALGAVGVGLAGSLITTGGIAAAVNTANFMFPTIAIGAGIGAGGTLLVGGIGEIISRLSKGGKRERLYAKFLRQKALCDSMSDEIEEKYEKQLEKEQKIEDLREKQRTGNRILKKLGIYKLAKKSARKKLRKLRSSTKSLERKHSAKVNDALGTKRELNAMEERTNKTLAMGGYLDKLRKEKSRINAELANPRLSEEEREDLQDELRDAIEDAEDEVEGISELGDEFQTFDQEAEDLINSVKVKKSDTMQNILSDIQSRNAKRVLQTKTAPVFDQAEVDEYLRNADASSNPVDKENAKELRKYLDELNNNKTDIATLVREGKISPRLANALMHSDVVEVPSSESVDVDLFETMTDDGKDIK